ncbi:MAG: thermonuclease family protein [Leptolyngbyaceae cyanobacterium HOT.MB2.61]|nr:thermonuclease family protein [Leptolyngbyaceae cyanobacterium HOT.MB2.61]
MKISQATGDGQQATGKSPPFLLGLVSLSFCLLLTACQALNQPQGLTVSVQQVLTGRDIEVTGIVGHPEITERVRLEGIDVPDLAQHPWGEAAKNWLKQAIGNHPVLLESDLEPRDDNGRRLAYLWQNGQLLNEKLVAEGYAIATPHPPNRKYDQRLARAQDRARVLGLGIWNPSQPMRLSPGEFRSSKGGGREDGWVDLTG